MLASMPKVPPMKAEAMINITQQLLKVQEEVDETIQAPKEQFIEELGDLIHSVIILTRVMENEGVNPARALERVIEKNRRRGYYDELKAEEPDQETFVPLAEFVRMVKQNKEVKRDEGNDNQTA